MGQRMSCQVDIVKRAKSPVITAHLEGNALPQNITDSRCFPIWVLPAKLVGWPSQLRSRLREVT